ncbi:hypothetical protein ACI68E_004415 [Malassezia pachydermatis]
MERLSRLEQVDVQKLLPALEARQAQEEASQPPKTREELLTYVTEIHATMLADARAILDRYNTLLPDEVEHDASAASSVATLSTASTPEPSATQRLHRPPRSSHTGTAATATVSLTTKRPQRVGPTLSEIASTSATEDPITTTPKHTDTDAIPSHDTPVPSIPPPKQRRNSRRTKSTSAFGERVPDYLARTEPFDDTMTNWITSTMEAVVTEPAL